MGVLYINFSASKDVLRNLNRTKEDLDEILKSLNNARNNSNIGVYVSNLSSYKSNIDSEIKSVKSDITKIEGFYNAYKDFLERAKEIDKECARGIKSEGEIYRKEEGLLKEEWKTFGKLLIGTLVIAGTIAAVVFVGGPIAIGAAVGACVSAGIGAGVGYISGGAKGAIDGFFSGAVTGAISGAIGGVAGGVPPLSGTPAKEILKYVGKQSIVDGLSEGLGGGIVGLYNNGIEGACQGVTYGIVSGLISGVISGGMSSRTGIKSLFYKQGKYTKFEVSKLTSTQEGIKKILKDKNITLKDFNKMRMKLASELTDSEKKIMYEIREAISAPNKDTIFQKVIHSSDIENYLKDVDSWNKVGGCLAKSEDVKNLSTLKEVYEALRLDYNGSSFNPDIDDYYGVIRFKTDEINQVGVPYGPSMEKVMTKPNNIDFDPSPDPFSGNGFTKDLNGNIIPEYKVNGRIEPIDGAEIYKVNSVTGVEELVGVFKRGKFIRS